MSPLHLSHLLIATFTLILTTPILASPLSPRASPSCTTFSIPVSPTAIISARYCEPTISSSRLSSLRILVHGATYTKDYWSGLAAPGTAPAPFPNLPSYSWIDYASTQGWPTLSIDRLCNGNSTHGDGLLECELPAQAEALHQVVNAARNGSLPFLSGQQGRKFDAIVMACHSSGSLVCNHLSVLHPGDADAYVLTGFSAKLIDGYTSIALGGFVPAGLVDPVRYVELVGKPAYLAATSRPAADFIFYFGGYDPKVAEYDFANRGTVTVGEVATAQLGQSVAREYTGKVLVVNGNEDSIFCESSPLEGPAGRVGNCSAGFSEGVGSLYPAAGSFEWYNVRETGHCLNLHYSARKSFRSVHEWLAKEGF